MCETCLKQDKSWAMLGLHCRGKLWLCVNTRCGPRGLNAQNCAAQYETRHGENTPHLVQSACTTLMGTSAYPKWKGSKMSSALTAKTMLDKPSNSSVRPQTGIQVFVFPLNSSKTHQNPLIVYSETYQTKQKQTTPLVGHLISQGRKGA